MSKINNLNDNNETDTGQDREVSISSTRLLALIIIAVILSGVLVFLAGYLYGASTVLNGLK